MRYPVAIFDFDGTVSLIREGWSRIMAEVGTDTAGVNDETWRDHLEYEMLALSGRPSLVQMEKLREELLKRDFSSPSAESLHDEFERRLMARIAERKRQLRTNEVSPEAWAVPGTHALLDALSNAGMTLYLVSGTFKPDVQEEMALLELTEFFEPTVYAPADRSGSFHKRHAIAEIMKRHNLSGEQLLSFGDGYSETVEVKAVGGTAIGVASVEVGKVGMNPMKAAMLKGLGADVIITDYQELSVINFF